MGYKVLEDRGVPIEDEDEDDYDDGEHEARSVPIEEREPYEEPPSPYTDSHDDAPSHDDVPVHEHDQDQDQDRDVTSPELEPPPSSSSVALQSERVYPARLSVASAINPELSSPRVDYLEWDETLKVVEPPTSASSLKKNAELSTAPSRWDKVKNTLMRTNSSQGRRSRTNSIRERTPNTDSSVTRESGASITSSSQADRGDKNSRCSRQKSLLLYSISLTSRV